MGRRRRIRPDGATVGARGSPVRGPIVNHSREQALALRSGRAWASRAAESGIANDPLPAASYVSPSAELDGLRTALTANLPDNNVPLATLRRTHEALDRALARAIALAFAADAHAAPTPPGIASWAAEGMARSYERELAMLDAMGICGLAQPVTLQAARFCVAAPAVTVSNR